MKMDVYYCTSCQDEFSIKQNMEPQYCPFCSNEVDYSHTVDPEQMNHCEGKSMEIPHEVIKAKYIEFVNMFLSDEPETVKVELMPNLWVVTNEQHDFHGKIECEFQVKDFRTMQKEWFAVVTVGNERSHFVLDFSEEAALTR